MQKLNIVEPSPAQAADGLHLARTTKVDQKDGEWLLSHVIKQGEAEFTISKAYPQAVDAHSELLRHIQAIMDTEMTRQQLSEFDMESLVGRSVVLAVVNKRGAGGKTTPNIGLVLPVSAVKALASKF